LRRQQTEMLKEASAVAKHFLGVLKNLRLIPYIITQNQKENKLLFLL